MKIKEKRKKEKKKRKNKKIKKQIKEFNIEKLKFVKIKEKLKLGEV